MHSLHGESNSESLVNKIMNLSADKESCEHVLDADVSGDLEVLCLGLQHRDLSVCLHKRLLSLPITFEMLMQGLFECL